MLTEENRIKEINNLRDTINLFILKRGKYKRRVEKYDEEIIILKDELNILMKTTINNRRINT
jgi:hypothetical protein